VTGTTGVSNVKDWACHPTHLSSRRTWLQRFTTSSAVRKRPAYYRTEPPPGVPQWNGIDDPHEVWIEDARGRESEFTLDRNGFALVKAPTAVTDFYDPEELPSSAIAREKNRTPHRNELIGHIAG
jgi:hypothetical protein